MSASSNSSNKAKAEKEAANQSAKRNRDVTTMINTMPKMDEQTQFVEWKQKLSDLAYYQEWLEEGQQQKDPDCWTPLDFDDEADESGAGKYGRKACIMVVKATMKNYEFLFEGIKQGNVQDMYKRIEAYFQPKTQSGFNEANRIFNNSSMERDHVAVSQQH